MRYVVECSPLFRPLLKVHFAGHAHYNLWFCCPGQILIKAIESEARIVSKLEDILVQASIYLSDKLRLTYLSWTNMAISHTCPERHICPEQYFVFSQSRHLTRILCQLELCGLIVGEINNINKIKIYYINYKYMLNKLYKLEP